VDEGQVQHAGRWQPVQHTHADADAGSSASSSWGTATSRGPRRLPTGAPELLGPEPLPAARCAADRVAAAHSPIPGLHKLDKLVRPAGGGAALRGGPGGAARRARRAQPPLLQSAHDIAAEAVAPHRPHALQA
jgi:hypothetical protein